MRASTDAFEGRYAACLDSDTASTKWLHQPVPVEPDQWYAATAWATANGGEAFLRVTWCTTTDGTGAGARNDDSSPITGDWSQLTTGPIRAPVDARSARVRLMLRPAGTATACFDDAHFDTVDEPPPTPTPTPRATATTAAASASPTPRPPPSRPTQPAPGAPAPSNGGAGASPVAPGTLRITEILSDAVEPGRDGPFEWVEIFNAGDAPVDLAGWSIADAAAADSLPGVVLQPGAYAVIAGRSATFDASVLVLRVPDGEIGNGLGNEGDVLRLRDPSGAVVDELSFGNRTDVFDPAPLAPEAGETLGLRDPHAEPGPENWAITLRPTPGEPNVFPAATATAIAGTRSPGDAPTAAPRTAATLQVDEGGDAGSIVPWMILGGLAGLTVGMLGAAVARLVRRYRERRRQAGPPPRDDSPPGG
jgi:hypothetical protein